MSKCEKDYKVIHTLAKGIVMCTVVALLLIGRYTGLFLFDIIAVVFWFFGVNFTAHVLEIIKKIPSKHDWI